MRVDFVATHMCLQRFAETLVRYGCWTVYGDAYTAGWVVSAFSERGIEYRLPTKRDSDATMDRSQLYLELLPTRRRVHWL